MDVSNEVKWYIAEIVEECLVEGCPQNVVHVNIVLVRASSPEDAFEKAEQLGREGEMTYLNPAGQVVTFTYRGLRDLYKVGDDELEHGTELIYEENVGVSEAELQEIITPKSELGLFRPTQPKNPNYPDYTCKEIMDEVEKMINPDDVSPDWERN